MIGKMTKYLNRISYSVAVATKRQEFDFHYTKTKSICSQQNCRIPGILADKRINGDMLNGDKAWKTLQVLAQVNV